jgi:hypothetical protein
MKKSGDLSFEEDLNYFEYYEIREKLQDFINYPGKKGNYLIKFELLRFKPD